MKEGANTKNWEEVLCGPRGKTCAMARECS
jgi:hypothetical protein